MSDFCVVFECHECTNRWGDDHCRVIVSVCSPPNLPTHCVYGELDAIWRRIDDCSIWRKVQDEPAPRPPGARACVQAREKEAWEKLKKVAKEKIGWEEPNEGATKGDGA